MFYAVYSSAYVNTLRFLQRPELFCKSTVFLKIMTIMLTQQHPTNTAIIFQRF